MRSSRIANNPGITFWFSRLERLGFVSLSRTVAPGATLSLIDEFLDHYSREFDYYAEVARIVQQKLEAALASHGIRAMVTSRAKRPDRLRDKLANRDQEKKYKTLKAIYKD